MALIMFDDNQTVNFPDDMLPMLAAHQLKRSESCCAASESLAVIGYGKNKTEGEGTYTLEETTLDFVTRDECYAAVLRIISGKLNITVAQFLTLANMTNTSDSIANDQSVICAIGQDTDVCSGDSGGPLFRLDDAESPEIVGVSSFVLSGCNSGVPSGFTSVGHYVEWIQVTANGGSYSPTAQPTRVPTEDSPTAQPTRVPAEKPTEEHRQSNDDEAVWMIVAIVFIVLTLFLLIVVSVMCFKSKFTNRHKRGSGFSQTQQVEVA